MPSAASVGSFSGVVCAAFSPSVVLFFTVVGKQPELVILTVGAAFIWLCTISCVALVWWVLVPARDLLWLLVLYSVVLQEGCRWATYELYVRLLRGLQSIGLAPTPLATQPNGPHIVPAAIASGLGIGLMQTLVMYGDVLGGSLRPGTLYTPACAGLSTFAVDALQSLASQVLHVLLFILGWTAAYPRRSVPLLATIVLLHLLASASTLLNSSDVVPTDGCTLALPCLGAVVLLSGGVAVHQAASSMCTPRKDDAGEGSEGGGHRE